MVQSIGKGPAVGLVQGGGTAGMCAGIPKLFHHVSYSQALADGFGRVSLAAWAERMAIFLQHGSGQRNVSGDDQIACFNSAHNFIIGHIKAARHFMW